MNTDDKMMETAGRKFLQKYWKMTTVFAALAIAAVVESWSCMIRIKNLRMVKIWLFSHDYPSSKNTML